MDWRRHPLSRWGSRPLGAALLGGAYVAARDVLASGAGAATHPMTYLIALLGFLCFSLGAALLLHGNHLFETVEIAGRWRRQSPTDVSPSPVAKVDRDPERWAAEHSTAGVARA